MRHFSLFICAEIIKNHKKYNFSGFYKTIHISISDEMQFEKEFNKKLLFELDGFGVDKLSYTSDFEIKIEKMETFDYSWQLKNRGDIETGFIFW